MKFEHLLLLLTADRLNIITVPEFCALDPVNLIPVEVLALYRKSRFDFTGFTAE